MAYLAFDESGAFPVTGPVTSPVIGSNAGSAPRPGFTALEWRVIALAASDGLASVARPSRIGGAIGRLFGLARATPLADPRLEALRRVTVLAWAKGDRVPEGAVSDFLAAGFDRGQLVLLLGEIARRRATLPKAAPEPAFAQAIGALVLLAVLIGTARIVGLYFGDMLIGSLSALLAVIAAVALHRMATAVRTPARLA
jgi:hypothetical protein